MANVELPRSPNDEKCNLRLHEQMFCARIAGVDSLEEQRMLCCSSLEVGQSAPVSRRRRDGTGLSGAYPRGSEGHLRSSSCHSTMWLAQMRRMAASSTACFGVGISRRGGRVRSSRRRREGHRFWSSSIVVHAPP